MIYIHYGASKFNPEIVAPIRNIGFVKPRGGLWASPEDSSFGWKHWCTLEHFHIDSLEKHFKFTISKEARIYTIDGLNDLKKLPMLKTGFGRFLENIDFEEMTKNYDAIHLTANGEAETHSSIPTLYGWDCESILILNPKYIKEL